MQWETFEKKKLEVLWLFAKVFTAKFRGVASFGGTSEHSPKVFSLESFLLYGMLLLGKQNLYGS